LNFCDNRGVAAAKRSVVSKGQLDPRWPAGTMTFERYLPGSGVDELVRHYWVVEWTLPEGRWLDQPVLQYPSCNIVVQPESSVLLAPVPEMQTQRLRGASWAFGVLLRPATGVVMTGEPLLRGSSSLELAELTGAGSATVGIRAAMTTEDAARDRHREAIDVFEAWIAAYCRDLDEDHRTVNRVAAAIEDHPELVRVADAADRFGMSVRTLERMVRAYTRMTPKWLIQRRRLQEAAHAINTDPSVDLSDLAHGLGYADYSHFSRDFATVLGATPGAFRDRAR
jgi:AraC-like DNA-binding protein